MIRVVALLMVLFISTPVAFAADLPEFGQTEREILTLYNQTAKEFNLPEVDPTVYCQKYDRERTLYRTYRLNPFMDILFMYNHDGGKPVRVRVWADDRPDSQTQKTYARTFMSLVQAFTPDLGEAERESLINSLGILRPDYSALGRIQARAGDIYFVFGANAGKILIGVSPMPKQ